MREQTDFACDLFVSYTDANQAWVVGYLLDAVETPGLHCRSEAALSPGVPRPFGM